MITVKIKNLTIYFLIIILGFLYLTNVENVSKSIINGLDFCANSLIPSLFPNLIISGLINDGTRVFVGLATSKKTILGNCRIYKIPIFTGMMCGYIVGPKAICSIYDDFEGKRKDFSLAIALSSNAGIGFVIGYVGVKIWSDIYFGIFLYLCQIMCGFLVFFILKSNDIALEIPNVQINKNSSKNIIPKVIISTFNSLCLICSFYIFFSFLTELISNSFNLNTNTLILLSAILDFSTGVFKAFSHSNKVISMFLTGFSIGFAGVSVHLQTFFVCEKYPLDKLRFFFFKLLQGIFCGTITLIYAVF